MRDVRRLYDFLVAYENLLRDGQRPVERRVRLEGVRASAEGNSDTVWCFAKADDGAEIYHFLNLTGTDDGWRDEKQTKPAPAGKSVYRRVDTFLRTRGGLPSPQEKTKQGPTWN